MKEIPNCGAIINNLGWQVNIDLCDPFLIKEFIQNEQKYRKVDNFYLLEEVFIEGLVFVRD